jgi:hypothetical protein
MGGGEVPCRFRASTENPKDHAGKPKPPLNQPPPRRQQKTPKTFRASQQKTPKNFQRREKFSCFKNPKKFSDRKFRASKPQKIPKSKEIRESREKKREKKNRKK